LNANITDGAQFDVFIDITPFTYDPADGNLLMEINFNAPYSFRADRCFISAPAPTRSPVAQPTHPVWQAGRSLTISACLLVLLPSPIPRPMRTTTRQPLTRTVAPMRLACWRTTQTLTTIR
jgi:hypothetical protein